MAQEAFEQLTSEWVALSDKITVDEDANYYIQNRGADILLAQEAGEAPQADNVNGTLIKPYEQAKYKANGGDLYLRAYNSNCSVNITSDKQQATVTWLDMTSGFIADYEHTEDLLPLTKTVDGYDVLIDFTCGDSVALTPTVTKDGTSAGTATTWLVITKNGEELDSFNFDNLICEATSEFRFDFQTNEDSSIGYFGALSIETDAEEGTNLFVVSRDFTYNGVVDLDLSAEIKVKLEA